MSEQKVVFKLKLEENKELSAYRDRELHDIARLVLQFHWKVLVAKDGGGVGERLQELTGRDSVVGIFADPSLQQTGHHASDRPAAIDKVALHAAHLGHVKMRFNGLTVGPDHRERGQDHRSDCPADTELERPRPRDQRPGRADCRQQFHRAAAGQLGAE